MWDQRSNLFNLKKVL